MLLCLFLSQHLQYGSASCFVPVLIPKQGENGNVIQPSSGTHVIEIYETSSSRSLSESSGSIYPLPEIFMEDAIIIAAIPRNNGGVPDNLNPSVTI